MMQYSKWWLGLKAGINYTRPEVIQAHTVFYSPSDYTDESYAKQYDVPFEHSSYQIGVVGGYAFTRHLSVFVQPTFVSAQFGYKTRYSWTDSDVSIHISQTHVQVIQGIEVPLMFRLSLPYKKFRLYGQAGALFGTLLNAGKSVRATSLEIDPLEIQAFNWGTQNTQTRDDVASSWKGLISGGGLSYDLGYLRLGMECNYRFGLNNRSNPAKRLDTPLISAFHDVADDLKTHQVEFSLVLSLPLDQLIFRQKKLF
jgi:hypothetical protein